MDIRTDTWIYTIELEVQKDTLTFMVNWVLTVVPRQFSGGNNSLFNNTGTTEHFYSKEWSCTSHHTEKLNIGVKTIKPL